VRSLFYLKRNLFDLARNLVELTAHEAFDRIKRIFRVRHGLALWYLADETVSVLCKCNDRRSRPSALGISDNNRLAAFHHRHNRVRRSKVDIYDFAHLFFSNYVKLLARQNYRNNILPEPLKSIKVECVVVKFILGWSLQLVGSKQLSVPG